MVAVLTIRLSTGKHRAGNCCDEILAGSRWQPGL